MSDCIQSFIRPQQRLLHRKVRLNKRNPARIRECCRKIQRIISDYHVPIETQVELINDWAVVIQHLLAEYGEIPGFWMTTVNRHVTLELCRDNPGNAVYRCLVAFDRFLDRHGILKDDANILQEGIISIHSDTLIRCGRIQRIPVARKMH